MVRITYRLSLENHKKEGEHINEEGRKEGSFSKWNLFFENNKHSKYFYFIFKKIHSRENKFRFSKQNTYKLIDFKLFKVLWTNY